MADISNICENESYDDIVITGDMNADPNKGRLVTWLGLILFSWLIYPIYHLRAMHILVLPLPVY